MHQAPCCRDGKALKCSKSLEPNPPHPEPPRTNISPIFFHFRLAPTKPLSFNTMTLSFLYLYLCSFILSISATSDWNKPCFSGVCEYNLPSSNGGSSGTLTIWGPSSAIGDITPAAGWAILTCSPEALKQTIRIACTDGGSPGCARLFGNATNPNDAVGKVVRLPETCGKNAFAIVAKATLAEDQSIPTSMMPSLIRRDGTLPTVHALHIDTSLEGAKLLPVEQQVHFAIRAANIPGAAGNPPNYISQNDTSIQGRGLSSIVKHGIAKIKSVNTFDNHDSLTLPPVDVNQYFTVINETISCPSFRAGVAIHVDTKSHAVMTVGVAATGTIVPPKIDSISLTSSISTNIDAVVDVTGNVGGTLDLAKIKLFNAGLPGLNFPGILSIGPSFEIAAKATASLDTEVDMKIGINYNINQASFTFPQHKGAGGGSFTPGDTPLKVNVTPSVGATGTVSVHLIPSLNFGISAFADHKKVNVFVNVDASVSATLGVTATEQTKQIRRDEQIPAFRFARIGSPPIPDHPTDHDSKSDSTLLPSPIVISPQPGNKLSVVARADVPPVSIDGCFEVDTGLSVNVGADADFFNLFSVTTQVPLFNQAFQLFKKCFGSSTPKRSLPPPLIRREPDLNREMSKKRSFDLQCLPLSPQTTLKIVDKVIPASSLAGATI